MAETRRSRSNDNDSEKIKNLKVRIANARKIRDDWQARFRLERLYDRFIGDSPNFDRAQYQVNRFWPTIKTILPSLFLQNPTFIVRSKNESASPGSLLGAQMAQAGLQAVAEQEHHLEFSVKLALLQSFFSIGVLKSSYNPTLIKNPRAGEPMFQTEAGFTVIDSETQAPVELIGPNGNPILEPERIVDDETYRWNWVNGDKMLLPPSGPDHLRWPWLAEEVKVRLDEARKDERFPQNLRSQLKANTKDDKIIGNNSEFGVFGDSGFKGDEEITYVEMWDISRRRHIIYAEGQNFSDTRLLLDQDTPEGVEHHPYAMLVGYTPILGPSMSPWPVPHVYNWLDPQDEYQERREQMTIGARRTARKYFFEEGTFADADDAVLALESNQDMVGVQVQSIDRPPIVNADPPLPGNIVEDLRALEFEWNTVTGVGLPRGRNTATEARIEESSGQARDLDMRHAVNVWLATAGQKMLQLMQGTMTLGLYIRMRGASDTLYLQYIARNYGEQFAREVQSFPGVRHTFDQIFGQDRWMTLSREALEFEAEVSVAPGSARPRNMDTEKQDFIQIIQLLNAAPILTQSRALLMRVAEMFEFFDMAMIDEVMAASQRSQQIEAIQAGRLQGSDARPAAEGGGANLSEFRRRFVG